MLLKHEMYKERWMFDGKLSGERHRTYAHLKQDTVQVGERLIRHGTKDLLVSVHSDEHTF
jgi:hypothetical protein